jgi:hypothetical protein
MGAKPEHTHQYKVLEFGKSVPPRIFGPKNSKLGNKEDCMWRVLRMYIFTVLQEL